MTARLHLVVGNWKMQGDRVTNTALLAQLSLGLAPLLDVAKPRVEVALCPPAAYLGQIAGLLGATPLHLGGQDVSDQANGAYTGEISASMLADLGCSYAIVGHSERRARHGETDSKLAHKVERLLGQGICPIICVGETLAQRESNLTDAVLAHQVDAVAGVLAQSAGLAVMAYEPVWAIGTGRAATPEMAQAAHHFIRSRLSAKGVDGGATRLLYGGSVTAASAAALFAQPDIDGGLVGGASRVAADFIAICNAAAQVGRA